MADEEQDRFALYHDFCRYSSSQEKLLSHAKFAREDETFPDEDVSPEMENSGAYRRKLDGVDESREKRRGKSAAADADSERAKNLGFRGERERSKEGEVSGTKLGGNCEGEREIEPQLKKQKVSPLVHCSGKRVIEGEDSGEEVVVSRGDLKVVMKSSLRSFVPESPEFTEKLDIEDGGDEVRIESGGKKKLEFCWETEVVKVEEEEGIGEIGDVNKEGGDRGDRGGEVGGDVKQGDGTIMKEEEEKGIIRPPRKRELPRSMFGLVWGERGEIEIGDRVVENRDVEGGLKEAKGDEGSGMVGNSNLKGALEDGNRDRVFEGGEKEAFDGEGSGDGNENGNGVVGNSNLDGGLKEGSIDGVFEGGEKEAFDGEGSGDGNGNLEGGSNEVRMEGNRDGESKSGLKEASFGEGSGGGNGNRVIGNSNLEGGLKEPNVEENRDGKSKGDEEESIRCLLDVLRMLGSKKSSHDDGEIDIFETAKRCGMTFPRSRFLLQVEEEE